LHCRHREGLEKGKAGERDQKREKSTLKMILILKNLVEKVGGMTRKNRNIVWDL